MAKEERKITTMAFSDDVREILENLDGKLRSKVEAVEFCARFTQYVKDRIKDGWIHSEEKDGVKIPLHYPPVF